MLGDEVGCVVMIAGEGRMADGIGGQAVVQEPRRGSTVQSGTIDRGGPVELEPKEVAEELVVAIPLGSGVERDEEMIRALNLHQTLTRSGRSGDRVTQRAGEAFEDRRANQEGPHLLVEGVEYLGAEVVDDVAIVAGEALDERFGVRVAPQREGREVQPGHPTLGPFLQDRHGRVRQAEA